MSARHTHSREGLSLEVAASTVSLAPPVLTPANEPIVTHTLKHSSSWQEYFSPASIKRLRRHLMRRRKLIQTARWRMFTREHCSNEARAIAYRKDLHLRMLLAVSQNQIETLKKTNTKLGEHKWTKNNLRVKKNGWNIDSC